MRRNKRFGFILAFLLICSSVDAQGPVGLLRVAGVTGILSSSSGAMEPLVVQCVSVPAASGELRLQGVLELGKVDSDKRVGVRFELVNQGDRSFELVGVKASCNCIDIHVPAGTWGLGPPNALSCDLFIKVPKTLAATTQLASFTLLSPKGEIGDVVISATIERPFYIVEKTLSFAVDEEEQLAAARIPVRFGLATKSEDLRVRLPDWVTSRIEEQDDGASGGLPFRDGLIVLECTSKDALENGLVQGSLGLVDGDWSCIENFSVRFQSLQTPQVFPRVVLSQPGKRISVTVVCKTGDVREFVDDLAVTLNGADIGFTTSILHDTTARVVLLEGWKCEGEQGELVFTSGGRVIEVALSIL